MLHIYIYIYIYDISSVRVKIKRYLHLSTRVTQHQITFSQVTQLITKVYVYLSVIKTTHFQIRAAIKDTFFFAVALRPNAGHGLLILEVSRSHTTTHHSRLDSCGRVISSSQRPLPDSIQHSQQTNIHAPGGIRTHDRSRRAAADLRLRPRGHWDRQKTQLRK